MTPTRNTKTIVIADGDIVLLELLRSRCEMIGVQVYTAARGDDALLLIRKMRPDVVCLDIGLNCADGRTVCEQIAADDAIKHTPTIVLSSNLDRESMRRCHELFAYFIPKGPNIWRRIELLLYELTDLPGEALDDVATSIPTQRQLRIDDGDVPATGTTAAENSQGQRASVLDAVFAWFSQLPESEPFAATKPPKSKALARKRNEPPWVLCIEDDADFSLALKLRLEAHGVAVVRAFDGTSGFRTAFTHPASAILLDYNLPEGQGDYVLRRLKENPVTQNIPVIVLTGIRDASIKRQMMGLGAAAYITKPLDFPAFIEQLGKLINVLPIPKNRKLLNQTQRL